MTRFPIKLEDKHTRQGSQRGQLLEAFLCLDVPASLIAETVARWKPPWEAGQPVAPLQPREQEALDWFKSEAFKPQLQAVKAG